MNKEDEEKLKELIIHSIKELGEIAECIVKKDDTDHWIDELGDLCAFGIKPMLDMAKVDFEYSVELGLRRKLKKLQGEEKKNE